MTKMEDWVKIRVVLDILAYYLSLYKNKELPLTSILGSIKAGISEVFGNEVADDVYKIVLSTITEDTTTTLRKVQEFLVRKIIEGRG